jgi:beta-glucanase (GH16 family)
LLGKNINEDGGYWDAQHGTTPWPACGEIDVMEYGIFHSEDVNFIGSALHTPCCHAGNPNHGGIVAQNIGSDFHVYPMNWSADEITFLLDSVPFYTYHPTVKDASTWPFFEDQYLLLNVAMGGFAGNIQNSFTQDEMVIDYVRVFGTGPPTSVEETLAPAISVYPNPVSHTLHISAEGPVDQVMVYNAQGAVVMQLQQVTQGIDVSNLPKGLYVVAMQMGEQQVVERIMVK